MNNRGAIFFALFLWAIAFIGLVGCHKIINVETETPPGTVPPPSVTKSRPPDHVAALPNDNDRDPVVLPPTQKPESRNQSWITNEFRRYYERNHRPRIVVFFNRQLSDEVREWNRTAQFKVEMRENSSKPNGNINKTDSRSYQVLAGIDQQNPLTGNRAYPGEKWEWAFLDGFVQPFLSAGAILVDYVTILRIEAADNLKANDELEVANLKLLEMESLRKHADFLIEILISQDASSPFGYSFKANAKDLDDGRILASALVLSWDDIRMNNVNKITATSQGYKIENDEFPSLNLVSERLALDLMKNFQR